MENLINSYSGLIKSIAKYFYNVDKEDLYQAGKLAIINAYKNFKDDGTTKFSTYVYTYIYGEMYKLAMQKNIKISSYLLKNYKLIEKTRYKLAQSLNRIPSNNEIASYLEMDEKSVNDAVMIGSVIVSSIDDNKNTRSLYETIEDESNINMLDDVTLKDSMNNLTKEEQDIIKYRYFEDLTQSEIAKKLNMTQVMVSRYEKKGINKMRDYYINC